VLGPLLGLLTTAVLVSPVSVARAQGAAPISVVQASITAINAGDLTALMALHPEDTTITVLPSPPVVPEPGTRTAGKVQVRAFWQERLADRIQIRLVGAIRVAGSRVTSTQRFTTATLRGQGQAIQGELEITVEGGGVTSVVVRNYELVPVAQFDALPAPLPASLPRTGGGVSAVAVLYGAGVLALGAAITARSRWRGLRSGWPA
jgi:hypothetical protein